jgi:hypothetical protein
MYEMIQSVGLFIATICMFQLGVYHRRILEKERRRPKPHNLSKEKNRFKMLFEKKDQHFVNSNIHPELYCFEKFEKISKEESEEEKGWKRRVLMQNTPQGNIVMFYDLFRQAFAYFSDVHINYSTLNQCAMRYVRLFSCRDFFVDTNVLPEDHISPFNQMKKEEEKREIEKIKKKREEKKVNFDSSMFVKKKKVEFDEKKNKEIDETIKNNFRYLGKLSNWNGLQPVPRIQKRKLHILDDYDHINSNPQSPLKEYVQDKSYSSWKNFKKQYFN